MRKGRQCLIIQSKDTLFQSVYICIYMLCAYMHLYASMYLYTHTDFCVYGLGLLKMHFLKSARAPILHRLCWVVFPVFSRL